MLNRTSTGHFFEAVTFAPALNASSIHQYKDRKSIKNSRVKRSLFFSYKGVAFRSDTLVEAYALSYFEIGVRIESDLITMRGDESRTWMVHLRWINGVETNMYPIVLIWVGHVCILSIRMRWLLVLSKISLFAENQIWFECINIIRVSLYKTCCIKKNVQYTFCW